jgi:hypothetical protein
MRMLLKIWISPKYWVQVHNLPSELMTVENAKSISASLGELLVVDNADNLRPSRKGFLRFRVLLNLLKSSHSQPRFHSP